MEMYKIKKIIFKTRFFFLIKSSLIFFNSIRMLDISVECYKNAEINIVTIGNRRLF